MTALEILESIVEGSNEALRKCYAYPNSHTPNMGVATIVQAYLSNVNNAIIELHKGNVK